MKLYTLVGASALVAFGAFGVAVAGPAPGGSSGTWQEGSSGIYTNTNNPELRFDTNTGRKAIPGNAGAAQAANTGQGSENSAIINREGNQDLLDPKDTCGGVPC